MRVTSKGQVTIPIEIRKALGIEDGSEVEFELDGGEARLRPRSGRGAEAIARMRGAGGGDMTTEQILALTRR